jgi:hypothetical protein
MLPHPSTFTGRASTGRHRTISCQRSSSAEGGFSAASGLLLSSFRPETFPSLRPTFLGPLGLTLPRTQGEDLTQRPAPSTEPRFFEPRNNARALGAPSAYSLGAQGIETGGMLSIAAVSHRRREPTRFKSLSKSLSRNYLLMFQLPFPGHLCPCLRAG